MALKMLLVGANGYGARFLEPLFNMHKEGRIVLEGIVTRSAFPMQEELEAAGIAHYKTLDEFYANHTADLALISTPAFLHKEQSIYCVEHGSNVLCEKPAAPTVEEVEAMIQAEKDTGKFIAIGYQRCFSDAILSLKKDILAGVLGKPISTKFLSASARALVYYSRGGGYAGQVYTKDGRMILDSPASNACAHYVQEMLFLLGEELDVTAEPTLVKGECLRANDITNFDTCTLKLKVRGEIPVYFATSHANEIGAVNKVLHTFDNATVTIVDGIVTATFKDGTVKAYGNPSDNQYAHKILHCLSAIENGTKPVCTVKTALPHIKLIHDIYRNIPIKDFSESEKVRTEEKIYVPGLKEKLIEAYEKECMLSEV